VAAEAHLEPDSLVELSLVEGKLVVVPLTTARLSLQQLIEAITDHNMHGEVDMGPPTGKEVW
jgi:antitoxin MazE